MLLSWLSWGLATLAALAQAGVLAGGAQWRGGSGEAVLGAGASAAEAASELGVGVGADQDSAGGGGGAGGDAAVTDSGSDSEAAGPGSFETAEQLLEALETADDGIRTLRSEGLVFVTVAALEGDLQTRYGRLLYDAGGVAEGGEAAGPRRVAIRFDRLLVGSRMQDERRWYIIDGTHLLEKIAKTRQATRRRLVPPGETFDPTDISQSDYWVPIGQRRADVERRFEPSLESAQTGLVGAGAPADLGWLARLVADDVQLALKPRAAYRDRMDVELVRVWYDRETLLPRAAMVLEPDGDASIVVMRDIALNEALPAGSFSTLLPRDPDWNTQEVPWRGESGAGS